MLHALQRLLQDPNWKVKAHALRGSYTHSLLNIPDLYFPLPSVQALGEIGMCDDVLLDQLLWTVRFERLPGVRAEACHALARLGLREEKVVRTLKDILTVDDDLLVLR